MVSIRCIICISQGAGICFALVDVNDLRRNIDHEADRPSVGLDECAAATSTYRGHILKSFYKQVIILSHMLTEK